MTARTLLIVAWLLTLVAGQGLSEGPASPPADRPRGWSDKPVPPREFVHPPLKCMEKYTHINEYPVMAWCFHGRGCPGYNETFVDQADKAGFNTLIDVQLMLPHAEKFDRMMVLVPAFKFNGDRLESTIFKPFGNHPRLIGCIMDDNCTNLRASMVGANYIAKNYPEIVPYVSENPTPLQQKNTVMRVLGTQNYQMWRGSGVNGYCQDLNSDRWVGNTHDMSFWPIFAAPIGHTAYRFSVYAALAYGAQGVVCFAYAPGDRWPEWKWPEGKLAQAARPVHMYARKVAGKYLWGTRCLGVFHSAHDAIPRGDGKAALTKLVQAMDANMLTGLLVPEKDFKAWKDDRAPDYAMVVDKRANRNWSGSKPRDVQVSFSPAVTHAEVFPLEDIDGPVKLRPIEPGFCVALHLDTGEGRFLRLNVDLKGPLGPLAEPYVALCRQMSDLALRARVAGALAGAETAKADPPTDKKGKESAKGKAKAATAEIPEGVQPLAAGEFQAQLAQIAQGVENLRAKANTDQSRDTLARLKTAVEHLKKLDPEAKPPQP